MKNKPNAFPKLPMLVKQTEDYRLILNSKTDSQNYLRSAMDFKLSKASMNA